nr:putative ATP-dependent RNA helicase TDRD12 isoform X2 [Leptinotarsa decemlineata]
MDSLQDLEISTVINPHLFWIISSSDARTKTLEEIEKNMNEFCKFKSNVSKINFEIGEIVAVRVKKRLCRAVVEQIKKEKISYLCWLIDYGFLIETEVIFKLPSSIRKTSAQAFQASFNNVTYFEQHLEYDESGGPIMVNEPTRTPHGNSRQVMMEFLSQSKSLEFKIENREDGIIFGDILYRDNDDKDRSLREDLIQRGILIENKTVFKAIRESINDYKERNLERIAKVCKSTKEILWSLTEGDDLDEKCNKLVQKYLDEFDSHDGLGTDEDEFSPYPFSKRNRSRHSNTNSLLDMTNTSESDSPKTPPKSVVSKKKLLLEKMLQYRNAKTESVTPSSTSYPTERDEEKVANSPAVKVSLPISSKGKKILEQMKRKGREREKEDSEVETPKSAGARKFNFVPGGSERSYFNVGAKKNTNRYSYENSSTQYSSEDSSSCRNVRQKRQSPKSVVPHQSKITCNATMHPKKSLSEAPLSEVPSSEAALSEGPSSEAPDNLVEDVSPENSSGVSEVDNKSSVSTDCKAAEGNGNNVNTMKIKPHCSCKQCDHWTQEENFWKGTSFQPKVAKIVEGDKQVLFREKEDVQNEVNIVSFDYSSLSKIDKQSMAKVLVHSESIPNPARVISKVSFHRDIHRSLVHLNYKEAKRIQSFAWAALFRNQHVCMVHGPQTGKTMAYLPVMCSFILDKSDRYESLLNISGGPIVVVLCSSSKKCEEVYDLAKILLGRARVKVHLITYPLGHVNASHIDLLVTTPLVLDDLLKSNAVNFKRLCHLILDDGDRLLNRHFVTMRKIFALTQSVLANRVYSKTIQLIVCAEHWSSRICDLLKSLQQIPMVCIGNFLEAALYGKMEFSMKFINSACKEAELKALLKETHKIYRSIVVCKEDELQHVETIMILKGIDYTVISQDMTKEDIFYMEEVWTQAKGGQYSVLVCSDFILNTMLSVTCASQLIHYSLPSSWTKFVKRFGCLLENCKSPLDGKEVRTVSRSVVLCDETCENEMHKFFSYMNSTELQHQLPDKLQKYSADLKAVEEEEKVTKAVGLCNDLKLFGKCLENRCLRRHVVNEALDVSNFLPKNGQIKFKIVQVQDVSCFSITLLQHEDGRSKVEDVFVDVTEELTATLKITRKKIHNPIVGHRYAFYDFEDREGTYHRCELLDVDNDEAKIKLLDKGSVISTAVARLFRLPREFDEENKPRTVIDAYLANFIPPFMDENYSAKSYYNVKNLLEQHNYKEVIFSGEVHLQLSNTLWLKNVYEEVTLSDRVISGFQLNREILLKKLAVHSNDQLHHLYKLCLDAGITLPTYERKRVAVVDDVEEKIVLQWAYLDNECPEEVVFLAAVSPDEIYVRLNKYSDLLYTLQKDIQNAVSKPHYPKLNLAKIGSVYLAKDPEGLEYGRVLILNKEEDKVLCFFVDFGDEAVVPEKELKFLSNQYITRLPFQSIQCNLHGIKPVSKEWDSEVTDMLYDYAMEPQTDIFRSLYVKVFEKGTPSIHGQKKYSVLLKDGFGEKKKLINQLLIECGFAVPSCEFVEDFEIPASQDGESDDSDVEEVVVSKEEVDEVKNRAVLNVDEFELFFDEEDEYAEKKFFKQIMTGQIEPSQTPIQRELPPIKAAPATDYFTPDVYWSQTDDVVRLIIKLTDVSDYKLKLTKSRILNFRTDKNEKTYCLKLVLYETVDSMQHTSPGPEIRITLSKTKPIDWPRLILAKQKQRNIHYDLTKVAVEEEKKKRFLQLPDELNEQESDDDDVIDMMYHFASDLDSDLDMELERDSD